MHQSLVKKPVNYFLGVLGIFLLLSSTLLYSLHQSHKQQANQNFIQQAESLLEDNIQQKKHIAQVIALTLAKNLRIRKAMTYEDLRPIKAEIEDFSHYYANNSEFKHLHTHFISLDGRSLVKSFGNQGLYNDLSQHPLVKKILKTHQAQFGIAVGGASPDLRAIYITPVFALEGTEVVGFIAVSQGFASLFNFFKNHHLDYLLLKPEKETFSKDQADYFNTSPLSQLKLSLAQIQSQQLTGFQNQQLYSQPIWDLNHQQILGAHVVSIADSRLQEAAWQQTRQAILFILAILVTIVFIALLLLWVIQKDILSPLAHLKQVIDQIIYNNQYDTQVAVNSDDEIGQVAQHFNHLIAKTHILLESLKMNQQAIDKSLIVSKADIHGNITYVNQKFCDITGYSENELIGKPHNIVRHPDVPKAKFQEIWQTIQAKKTWSGELKNQRKDGSSYYVMSYIIPMLDAQQNIKGYFSIRQDITEIAHLRHSLQDALLKMHDEKVAAEHANRVKSEFLSSMSHELRTPLNSIIGFSQVLQKLELSNKQLQYVNHIHNSGNHLLNLINDILEMAKIEAGKLEVKIQPISLAPIMQQACEMVQSQAEQLQIQLHPNCDGFDQPVLADPIRVKQVLLNLLNNAIKYNRPQGSVTCYQRILETENAIEIHIQDTGVGIPEEKQALIFEPFNRIGYENSHIEGSGIGLTITKSLIEKMGGTLGFSSRPQLGSDFWFKLPLAELKKNQKS